VERLFGLLVRFLPILFAFGFLVPVIRQIVIVSRFTPPLGLSALGFAFLVGGSWGLVAQIRGRWI
jgi:hypothetical protein